MSEERFDRRGVGVLATGHLWADFLQGAIPALLPFLIAEHGYSYGAAGALLLAASLGSSIVQPLFGVASDRFSLPWLMPLGLAIGGAGLAVVGLVDSYAATFAAVVVSGLGVAAFHPEAARWANYASRGERGRGMSFFSLGGNAGFALGPLLMTPAVLAFGLHGTVLALIPLWLAAGLRSASSAGCAARARPGGARERPQAVAGARRMGPVRPALVRGRPALRDLLRPPGVHPGLLRRRAGDERGGRQRRAERDAGRGRGGDLRRRPAVDRLGRRPIVVLSMGALAPLLVAFLLVGRWPATVLLVAIGFVVIANFSITVVMSQEYLPNRLGLASGITLGAAIGVGGLAAAALGALADATSLTTTLWVIALIPIPAFLIALTLPPTSVDRELARSVRAFTSAREQRSAGTGVVSGGHGGPLRQLRRSSPGCVGA